MDYEDRKGKREWRVPGVNRDHKVHRDLGESPTLDGERKTVLK
jgi:hypothetical protein